MGRKSLSRSLSVWANGLRVGLWAIPNRGDDRFVYDRAWMDSAVGRPLSLSLPFTEDGVLRGENVQNYFDNLLPDNDVIRRRLATRFKTGSTDAFELLQAIGRDCVGAVQLLADNEGPTNVQRIVATPLTDAQVAQLLRDTTSVQAPGAPLDPEPELRISLAGAQEKTALLWHQGGWHLPHGSTPTTHILKLPLGLVGHRRADFRTSVENEWLCMQLLAEFGLPVAVTQMLQFEDQKVLCVERFDRQLHSDGTWLMRLPQEDFCQALGQPSSLKYESDGGPGLAALSAVLAGAVDPTHDRNTLLTAAILFWLMAATDGHAKNFSIRIHAGGRYSLTPLYDVMSIWPVEGNGLKQIPYNKAKLAMAFRGKAKHYALREVQRRHMSMTAAASFQRSDAEDLIESILAQIPAAIANVTSRLPDSFPPEVADRIFAGLRQSAVRLDAMPSN